MVVNLGYATVSIRAKDMSMSEDIRYYTTQEVAEELGVSDAYIRKLIGKGIAEPLKKIGNTWVFTGWAIKRLRDRPKRNRKK